ncbi:Hypothetical protein SMAX5B_000100 [Scophthalmus maximus]|uniref:Uncharacterized protein n=1 Tax=Scophthalmus maximus TaxID=52904 RepID=A0A2U9CWA7_SCOMX|nr:Hypothetical protein SMAX5B_000100 [Scophthalmus maximus]
MDKHRKHTETRTPSTAVRNWKTCDLASSWRPVLGHNRLGQLARNIQREATKRSNETIVDPDPAKGLPLMETRQTSVFDRLRSSGVKVKRFLGENTFTFFHVDPSGENCRSQSSSVRF